MHMIPFFNHSKKVLLPTHAKKKTHYINQRQELAHFLQSNKPKMVASYCLSPQPFLLLKSPCPPSTHSNYRLNSSLAAKHYHVNSILHCSSLSICNGSTSLRSNVLRPAMCHAAFDGFPIPHKKDERINSYQNLITKVGATVILTCALGMITCSSNAKAIPSDIQKLMIMNQMNSSSSQGGCGGGGRKGTQRANVREIKEEVYGLADQGDFEKAVTYLKAQYESHEFEEDLYLIDILLVDMLSRQGKYKEALERKCLSTIDQPKLNDPRPSNTRINLYKTSLYLMQGDYARAKIWCKALLKNPPRDSAGQTPHFMEDDDNVTDE